ncbi:hypothetical protein [Rikenella microfusus]|uniref:Uncharacterized protein n=1 Tax=Rikenella microfusus TaxID=28139 RepID=A0A379MNN5_9BACT|nr:hypothetical protein [Rikenella microfusus]SUE33208.1 Uncharacterised protein [Rikenella microfusus]HJE88967.1 hypothetical protein [Rikenella microfusus]
MKEEKKTGCCSCEKDFEKQVKKTVDAVEKYTGTDHEKKKAEVEAAFAEDKRR